MRLKSGRAEVRLRSKWEVANAIRKIADDGEGLYQDRRGHSEIEKSKDVGNYFPVRAAVRIRRLRGEETTT